MTPRFFFIIGAQRSGSTSLARLIGNTTGFSILGAKPPEARLFLNSPSPKVALARLRALAPEGTRWMGEKATTYLERKIAADRIFEVVPDAPIIVVLRNPVDRAVSNYEYSVANGLESLPLEDALTDHASDREWDSSRLSTSPFHYLRRSEYSRLLAYWIERFPSLQIHILEELIASDQRVRDVFVPFDVDDSINQTALPLANAQDELRASVPDHLRKQLLTRFEPEVNAIERRIGRQIPSWH